MLTRKRLILPAAAVASALLLAGCGDDDSSSAGLGGGDAESQLDIPDVELEQDGGNALSDLAWYGLWLPSGDGELELYATAEAVLWGDRDTDVTCTSATGLDSGSNGQSVSLTCSDGRSESVQFNLVDENTLTVDWEDRTEEFSKFEGLDDPNVDLEALEAEWNL